MALTQVLDHLGAQPQSVATFFDFDGVLSSIQDDPASVQPTEGALDRITSLASEVGVLAIVSGRPIDFLCQFFDQPNIALSGLYGLEQRIEGELTVDPIAMEHLPTVQAATESARAEFGEARVEDKTYSITIHYRGETEEFAERLLAWADETAARTGLLARPAKKSVELHPPVSRTKGSAVRDLVCDAEAAAYFGDDVGDLPAFEELARLDGEGSLAATARVAVAGAELPASMRSAATDVIDGPQAVLGVLDEFLARINRA